MRINKFSQSGSQNSSLSQGLSATLTGPLVLAGNPTGPLEATPKQYVDNSINSLNAVNIKTGTINVARLPAFTGDVSSATGSGNFVLNNTGVTAGTYTKVTTDSKGRVLAGSNLTNDDIPPFNWSKIGSDKPTTIDGYGITDAIKTGGATITGRLTLNLDPTDPMHAANKQYVDSLNSNGANVTTGSVVRRPVSTTPTGFLRANGGLISKTTYSALFAVIKDPYIVKATFDYTSYGAMGAGKPWQQHYDINATQSNDITGWTTDSNFPVNLYGGQAIVTKNRVYILGGVIDGTYTNRCFTAVINGNGSLGAWSEATLANMPVVGHSQAIVTKNKVYLIGGTGGSGTNMVMYALINADGTLSGWNNGNYLPAKFGYGQAVVTKNRVYVMTGAADHQNANISNVIYSAAIDTNGLIGTWSVAGATTHRRANGVLFVIKNYVYVTGGISEGGNGIGNTEYAPINADGTLGSWTQGPPLYSGSYNSTAFVTKNKVYVFGSSGGNDATVWTASINADGTINAWAQGTSLAAGAQWTHLFATSSRLYLVCGYVNNTTTVRYAPITGGLNDYSQFYDGTINKFDGSNLSGSIVLADNYGVDDSYGQPGRGRPWQQQYSLNLAQDGDITGWTQSAASLPIAAQLANVVVTKNRVYLLGCRNASGVVTSTYSAPINADGTLGTWVAGTSLPTPGLSSGVTLVTKNRVYIIAGDNNNVTYATQTVLTAPINADGTLGAWTTGPTLPDTMSRHTGFVTKDRVYVLGTTIESGSGIGGNRIYTAAINADGTLAAWTVTGGTFNGRWEYPCLAIVKNRIYVFEPFYTDIHTAVINADGTIGTFSVMAEKRPYGVSGAQTFVTKNRIYFIGAGETAAVRSVAVNADGSLGAWMSGSSLPLTTSSGVVFATKNRIYHLGGSDSGGSTSKIYSAPINGGLNDYSSYYDGTITAVDNTTFALPDFSALEATNEFYFVKT